MFYTVGGKQVPNKIITHAKTKNTNTDNKEKCSKALCLQMNSYDML